MNSPGGPYEDASWSEIGAVGKGTAAAAGLLFLAPEAVATDGMITVTSWAAEGAVPDLAVGRYAMTGGASWSNYLKAGFAFGYKVDVNGRGPTITRVPFSNSITAVIPSATVSWPTRAIDFLKGMIGQGVITGK